MSELNQRDLFQLASRIDSVCDRFEAAWHAGESPQIEDCLEEAAEADRDALLRALLTSELELLAESGRHADESECCRRFPQYAEPEIPANADSAEYESHYRRFRDAESIPPAMPHRMERWRH